MIVIGAVVYWELHPEIPVPEGKRWERTDDSHSEADFLARPDADCPFLRPRVENAAGSPARYLDYLRDVSGSEPTRVGEADVRGAHTVHYRAVIDNRRFWRREAVRGEWSADTAERTAERFGATLPSRTTPIEAWIDYDGFARRVVTYDELWPLLDGSDPVEMEPIMTTVEFFDFGAAADIQPPPDAEVIEEEDMPRRED